MRNSIGILFIFFYSIINLLSQNDCSTNVYQNQSNGNRNTIRYNTGDQPPFEKWQFVNQNGPAIVYFNNDLTETTFFRDTRHSENFNLNYVNPLLNWCMNYWQAQCAVECRGGIEWAETNNGARFYWTINPEVIERAHGYAATAVNAASPNNIVPVSAFGVEVISSHGMSEIILNNSDEYYLQSGDYYYFWTTDPASVTWFNEQIPARRGVLFQYILLHEMGHYLGLPHDWSGMMQEGYWERIFTNPNIELNSCDADRFRKLYCEECMGRNPVRVEPSSVCENKLAQQDYPTVTNLVVDNKIYITYNLNQSSRVLISLHDIQGRLVKILADEFQIKGIIKLSYSASGLAKGLYVLSVINEQKLIARNLIIIK